MPTPLICSDCGETVMVIGTRTLSLIRHMVNAGELSVGEARAELNAGYHDRTTIEFLAGWVLDRADQGDHWRAGDQETLPCGCIVSYDRTQVGSKCESTNCLLDAFLCPLDGSETF